MSEERKRMDCTEFKDIYHDLDRPGTLEASRRERALMHAEYCSRCAALLTEAEALDFALHSLAQESASRQASPRVEAALLQEFQREKVRATGRRLQWQVAVLGAAAGIALVIGLALHHRIVPSINAVQPTAKPEVTASHGGAVEPQQTNTEQAGRAGSANIAASASSVSESGDDEYAGNFVPVPYADDPAALEGGAIVRVTLPRSALVSFGLPITDGGDADTIAADLVVAEDGTPQAIRLVSQSNANSDF
jgi:hypothetical protein